MKNWTDKTGAFGGHTGPQREMARSEAFMMTHDPDIRGNCFENNWFAGEKEPSRGFWWMWTGPRYGHGGNIDPANPLDYEKMFRDMIESSEKIRMDRIKHPFTFMLPKDFGLFS